MDISWNAQNSPEFYALEGGQKFQAFTTNLNHWKMKMKNWLIDASFLRDMDLFAPYFLTQDGRHRVCKETLSIHLCPDQKQLYYIFFSMLFLSPRWCWRWYCINIYVNNELLGNNKYVFITNDENEEHSADKTNWEHQNS